MKSILGLALVVLLAGSAEAQEWAPLGDVGPWDSEILQCGDALVVVVGSTPEGQLLVRHLDSGEPQTVDRDEVQARVRMASIDPDDDLLGQTIEVEWNGSYYQARVLGQGPDGLKVHFIGWAANWDEVVDPSRGRTELRLALTRPTSMHPAGTPVEICEADGSWTPATIAGPGAAENHYLVCRADGSEEEVQNRRIRYEAAYLGNYPAPLESPPGVVASADTDLPAGTVVAVAEGSQWYLALVKATGPDGVEIRWLGYPPTWDATFPYESVRAGFELVDLEERPTPR
jgi:hypothetical protein